MSKVESVANNLRLNALRYWTKKYHPAKLRDLMSQLYYRVDQRSLMDVLGAHAANGNDVDAWWVFQRTFIDRKNSPNYLENSVSSALLRRLKDPFQVLQVLLHTELSRALHAQPVSLSSYVLAIRALANNIEIRSPSTAVSASAPTAVADNGEEVLNLRDGEHLLELMLILRSAAIRRYGAHSSTTKAMDSLVLYAHARLGKVMSFLSPSPELPWSDVIRHLGMSTFERFNAIRLLPELKLLYSGLLHKSIDSHLLMCRVAYANQSFEDLNKHLTQIQSNLQSKAASPMSDQPFSEFLGTSTDVDLSAPSGFGTPTNLPKSTSNDPKLNGPLYCFESQLIAAGNARNFKACVSVYNSHSRLVRPRTHTFVLLARALLHCGQLSRYNLTHIIHQTRWAGVQDLRPFYHELISQVKTQPANIRTVMDVLEVMQEIRMLPNVATRQLVCAALLHPDLIEGDKLPEQQMNNFPSILTRQSTILQWFLDDKLPSKSSKPPETQVRGTHNDTTNVLLWKSLRPLKSGTGPSFSRLRMMASRWALELDDQRILNRQEQKEFFSTVEDFYALSVPFTNTRSLKHTLREFMAKDNNFSKILP